MTAPILDNAVTELLRLLLKRLSGSVASGTGSTSSGGGPTFPIPGLTVHVLDGEFHSDAADTTDLDATTAHHGLLPKLSGVPTEYLGGDGLFTTPAGGGGGHTHVDNETPAGTIDSVNDTFTLAGTPSPAGSLHLHKNGLLQQAGAGNDFTLSGLTITFLAGNLPQSGDILLASYRT